MREICYFMKIHNALIFSALLVALNGCAVSDLTAVNDLITAGSCSEASAFAKQNFSGVSFYHQIARIENECKMNRDKSIQLLNLTARYGHEESIEYLNSLNVALPNVSPQPIPRVTVSSPSVPTLDSNSSSRNNNPMPISNRGGGTLVDTQPIVGGAMCTYSDGSVIRKSGDSYCPRSN